LAAWSSAHPNPLRTQLRALSSTKLVAIAAAMRPGPDLTHAVTGTKAALRRVAHRHQLLSQEFDELDRMLQTLVATIAPQLVALMGIGTDAAGQLLVTAGDNATRLTDEAASATYAAWHRCQQCMAVRLVSGRRHKPTLKGSGCRAVSRG